VRAHIDKLMARRWVSVGVGVGVSETQAQCWAGPSRPSLADIHRDN
jgi:hypothetical protein